MSRRRGEANVEYLIFRRVRHGILRGKGKVSFPVGIEDDVIRDDAYADLARLSERMEEAWRTKLKPKHVRELTVSWREHWLGHWNSPLD